MPDQAGDYNQAIMELGEIVCIPNGTPICSKCPLHEWCLSYRDGCQQEYPFKPAKKARRIEEKTICIFDYEGRYAIRKRPKTGLLAGLYEFPSIEGKLTEQELRKELMKKGIYQYRIQALQEEKHIFSHVEWHMVGYRIELAQQYDNHTYATKREIEESYPLPTAFQTYFVKL